MSLLRQLSPLVLAIALLAACGEGIDPLSPESADATAIDAPEIVTAVANGGAVVERGSGVFTFDGIQFLDCVGEDVRSIVYAPYDFVLVETPTGDFVYHELWDTEAVTGTLIGQTSGIVWERTDNVSPMTIHSMGGGLIHYTFKGRFESDVAPDLKVREVFHLSRNAAGDLTAAFYKPSCRQE